MLTLTVFADTRLFSLWLAGEEVAFSQKVMYVYGKQMEEAGLLVLNKRDLVSPGRARQALEDARGRFPGKSRSACRIRWIRFQVDSWLDELDAMSKRPAALQFSTY